MCCEGECGWLLETLDWIDITGLNVRIHTVASQQTRTSYRWPGIRFWRKNHESVPSGASVVGNDTFNFVRIDGLSGESLSRPKSSRSDSPDGIVAAVGPRKMVFSTFAFAMLMKHERTSPKQSDAEYIAR